MNDILIYLGISLIMGVFPGIPLLIFFYHRKIALVPVTSTKADFSKRILAVFIDSIVGSLMFLTLFFNTKALGFPITVTLLYFLLKDGIFMGKSIGKFITGLVVIRLTDGKTIKITHSILRNFIFIVPGINITGIMFEIFVMYKDKHGLRLGDKIALTQVVSGKSCVEYIKNTLSFLSGAKEVRKNEF